MIKVHEFEIGQAVTLKSGFVMPVAASDIYVITAKLPERGNSLQYRIRNSRESYERVTTQDNLRTAEIHVAAV